MAEATPGQKAYTLAVFFCINLLNYSDRQVPRVKSPPRSVAIIYLQRLCSRAAVEPVPCCRAVLRGRCWLAAAACAVPWRTAPHRCQFSVAFLICCCPQAVSGVLPLLLSKKTNELGADVSAAEGGMLTTSFIIVYMCVSRP